MVLQWGGKHWLGMSWNVGWTARKVAGTLLTTAGTLCELNQGLWLTSHPLPASFRLVSSHLNPATFQPWSIDPATFQLFFQFLTMWCWQPSPLERGGTKHWCWQTSPLEGGGHYKAYPIIKYVYGLGRTYVFNCICTFDNISGKVWRFRNLVPCWLFNPIRNGKGARALPLLRHC